MPFNATLDVRTLSVGDGFRIDGWFYGVIAGPVVGVGDFNGDGIADMLVAAPGSTEFTGPYHDTIASRSVFVVFGRNAAVEGAGPPVLELFDQTASNGFAVTSEWVTNGLGLAMASIGDVNGDGLDDMLLGAPLYRGYDNTMYPIGPYNEGRAYVVFGRSTAGGPGQAAAGALDGVSGFVIGSSDGHNDSRLGQSVYGLGDINGDGLGDMMVTRFEADFTPTAYVLFGKDVATDGAFSPFVDVEDLDGTNGFVITDAGIYSRVMVGAADINHDGIDDLVLGAGQGGGVKVVFGRDTATTGDFAASYTYAQFTAQPGFSITGGDFFLWAGMSVASAGDVNGDGVDDLIVSASPNYSQDVTTPAGAWVVFGRDVSVQGGFGAGIDLNTLDGTNGFRIYGAGENFLGLAVRGVGDLNGDGYDDVAVSSAGIWPFASGRISIVFGGASLGPVVQLSSLNGTNGFIMAGENDGTFAVNLAFGGAGDVNGDGIDDLMVQTVRTDPSLALGYEQSVYVIHGRADRVATAAGGVLNGGASNDRLTGGIGNDVLNGLAGNDELDGGDKGDVLNGGDGVDKLYGGAGGDVLNGDDGDDQLTGGADGDKLFGGAGADYLGGGAGADRLDGGADADALEGNDGNDVLDGGAGDDALYGGTGNDIYLFQAGEDDTAIEFANEGFDIVRSWRSVSDLWFHIEGLELQGGADLDGTGNANANNLQGNAGENRLSGLAGVDTINGNDGDDVIVGGAGNDLLRGGLGADRFVVLQESLGATLETDQVYDFSAAEGDWIDLSGIDARPLGADDAFTLVGAFTKHAGEMTLTFAGGITTLRLDVNGDGKVDYQMKINGDVTGDSGGWLL